MQSGKEVVVKDFMLSPGYICFPAKPTRLCAVVGSGAVVAVYDRTRKRGGMTLYSQPYRDKADASTAKYAGPAIVTLVRMFLESGSKERNLETHLYGGAAHPEVEGYVPERNKDNVKVGLEILEKLRITNVEQDCGGSWGRKVVFHTGTGEVILAKVERIRSSDWYPQ